MWFWDFLLDNQTSVELISTLVFGAVSVLVGLFVAAATAQVTAIAYRASVGWRPVVLIVSVKKGLLNEAPMLGCGYEVWNTRSYPVKLVGIQVRWNGVKVSRRLNTPHLAMDAWHASPAGNMCFFFKESVNKISPGEHLRFDPEAQLLPGQHASLKRVEVWVRVYDPKDRAHYTIYARDDEDRPIIANWSQNLLNWSRINTLLDWIYRSRRMPDYGAITAEEERLELEEPAAPAKRGD